ncbi:hypothetical protein FB45DRAFT_1053689 [Roridomyces roridus]|uniref:Uncharacterized protein n=1 Tax=Roridomyces roridus TaxID=1738132 RepID=A0AAD7FV61_9AGAR|nr:hypothetical protein FB45DRAFT_1053689 [Roridomyces roridus]
MFFTQLALLSLSASAAYVGHFARNLGPPVATLNAITAELKMIDFDLDPENFNSASNTSVAFVIDGTFEAVNAVTLDASFQIHACVSLNGVASPEDAAFFINLANTTYVPELLSVLNKTIIAKPIFFQDSLPELDLVENILADLNEYLDSSLLYLGNLTMAAPNPGAQFSEALDIEKVVLRAFDEAIDAYECPGASTVC